MSEMKGESWDDISRRVVDESYAQHLYATFQAYQQAGFSLDQAWQLIQVEHHHRLNLVTQRALSEFYVEVDGPEGLDP